jgi:hypothetical protein
VLIQLFPPDDERLSLETCRGGKINTFKKEKSASSWLKIHNCLRMHGQQNIKKLAYTCCTFFVTCLHFGGVIPDTQNGSSQIRQESSTLRRIFITLTNT